MIHFVFDSENVYLTDLTISLHGTSSVSNTSTATSLANSSSWPLSMFSLSTRVKNKKKNTKKSVNETSIDTTSLRMHPSCYHKMVAFKYNIKTLPTLSALRSRFVKSSQKKSQQRIREEENTTRGPWEFKVNKANPKQSKTSFDTRLKVDG